MIQGYTLSCDRGPDLPPLIYHGIVLADGESYDTRTEKELSEKSYVNRRFQAALDEYGRYAFSVIWTCNYDSALEAIEDEAKRIARDDTTHPDKGLNVEPKDAKRYKKALAEHTPGACEDDQWQAAIADFRKNTPDFSPYDAPDNEAALRAYAVAEKCGVATAFANLRDTLTRKESA